MPPNRRTRTNRALGPLEALEAPARETIAVGRRPHPERHCACAACLCASSGASQRHDAGTFSCWIEEARSGRGSQRHDAGTFSCWIQEARSGRGLIRMCVCAIMWAAWRTSERPVHPQRHALWAGGRVNERLRMRTRCAYGLRSPQAVHNAMGTEGTNWRVADRHGGQTGRMGALGRLLSGLGGSRAVCGEALGVNPTLTWPY